MLTSSKQRRAAVLAVLCVALLMLAGGSVDARQYVTVERVNLTTIGQQAGQGQRPVTNFDGRYVVFWSDSNILVPGDVNNLPDIFVKDRVTAGLKILTATSAGVQANAINYVETDISAIGPFVVFASDANNLVANDTNSTTDVFTVDVLQQVIARANLGINYEQANGASLRPVISGNATTVAFRSAATNLVQSDTNGQWDVFAYDRTIQPPNQFPTQRMNVSSAGVQSNAEDATGGISINEDGKQIAFESRGSNLVTSDTNGVADIFVRDRKNAAAMVTVRVSVASDGTQANGASTNPAISPTGRYVLFASTATNLVAGDTNGVSDVFLHDRDLDADNIFDEVGAISTIRISVTTDGSQANGGSFSPSVSDNMRNISYWSSASNLVTNDTNGVGDIFVYDTVTKYTTRASVGRNGEQANGVSSLFSSISADSRLVVFESSATNLVTNDTNNFNDIFLTVGGPAAPTKLKAVGASNSQINLTWKDNASDESRYVVERSTDGGVNWSKIANNLAANTQAYSDSSLPGCGQYSYRVFAANDITNSPYSNVANSNTLGCPPGTFTLLTPADDSTVINPNNLNEVTWSAATEAETYNFILNRTVGVVEEIANLTVNAVDVCAESNICTLALTDPIQAELTEGEYAWTVSATNDLGTTNAANNPFAFVVDPNAQPRAFELLSPKNKALIRNPGAFTAITWDFNPDAATYGFLLLKGSNNPIDRDLGIIRDLTGLTPESDADVLVCDTVTCTFTVDTTLQGELSTGTYMWTAMAFSPGGTETEAQNAPRLFSINTSDVQLLANTGFEDDLDGNSLPDQWAVKNLTSDKRKCNKPSKTFANAGLCAFSFLGGANEKSSIQQKPDGSSYQLAVDDNLTLSVFVNGKNVVVSAAYIDVTVTYENTSLAKEIVKLTPAGGTYDYAQLSGVLTLDGEVKSIRVRVGYKGISGKLLVDDVTLTLEGFDTRGNSVVSSRGTGSTTTDGLVPLPVAPESSLGNNTSSETNNSLGRGK